MKYTVVAHADENAYACGLFDTYQDAQDAIDALGPPRGPQDEVYYLSVVPIETGSVRDWWDELTEDMV